MVVDLEKVAPVLLLQVGEDFSTQLLHVDATFDFAPTVRGTNGGSRAGLLVLSN